MPQVKKNKSLDANLLYAVVGIIRGVVISVQSISEPISAVRWLFSEWCSYSVWHLASRVVTWEGRRDVTFCRQGPFINSWLVKLWDVHKVLKQKNSAIKKSRFHSTSYNTYYVYIETLTWPFLAEKNIICPIPIRVIEWAVRGIWCYPDHQFAFARSINHYCTKPSRTGWREANGGLLLISQVG